MHATISTVNDYFEALLAKTELEFPVYNSDFAPFIEKVEPEGEFDVWSGYYSNYPALK